MNQSSSFSSNEAPTKRPSWPWLVLVLVAVGIAAAWQFSSQRAAQPAPVVVNPQLRLTADPIEDKIDAFKAKMRDLLNKRSYAELERMAADGLRDKGCFENGEWHIRCLNESVAEGLQNNEADWDKREGCIRGWVAEYPKSVSARAAMVEFLTRRAWFYRGDKWASQVPQDAWPKFERYLKSAQQEFETARALEDKSPELYSRGLIVAKGLGLSKEYTLGVFYEGKKLFPEYRSLYTQIAYYLLPRWHGKRGEFESFLFQETRDVKDGDCIYTGTARRTRQCRGRSARRCSVHSLHESVG